MTAVATHPIVEKAHLLLARVTLGERLARQRYNDGGLTREAVLQAVNAMAESYDVKADELLD